MEKPRWKHDCDTCEFLGRHDSPEFITGGVTKHWDLYVHFYPNGSTTTIVARYGNEPDEYVSGLDKITCLPIVEGMRKVIIAYVRVDTDDGGR